MLNLKWSIKNYGDLPAVNVRISPRIVPYLNEFEQKKLNSEQTRVCAETMSAANSNPIGGLPYFLVTIYRAARELVYPGNRFSKTILGSCLLSSDA